MVIFPASVEKYHTIIGFCGIGNTERENWRILREAPNGNEETGSAGGQDKAGHP